MMHPDERNLIELTRRWERDRRTREVGGIPEPEPDETPEALTRRQLKKMLLRDRSTKNQQETK